MLGRAFSAKRLALDQAPVMGLSTRKRGPSIRRRDRAPAKAAPTIPARAAGAVDGVPKGHGRLEPDRAGSFHDERQVPCPTRRRLGLRHSHKAGGLPQRRRSWRPQHHHRLSRCQVDALNLRSPVARHPAPRRSVRSGRWCARRRPMARFSRYRNAPTRSGGRGNRRGPRRRRCSAGGGRAPRTRREGRRSGSRARSARRTSRRPSR